MGVTVIVKSNNLLLRQHAPITAIVTVGDAKLSWQPEQGDQANGSLSAVTPCHDTVC